MARRVIGRKAERDRLAAALRAAADGNGGLAMVSGESEIGKTALLRDLAATAREVGVEVLSGRAVADAGPYRPFAEALSGALRSGYLVDRPSLAPHRAALGRLLPGWATAAPPETGLDPTLLLGEAVLEVLGQGGPALVLLDDLHEADPDSVALL